MIDPRNITLGDLEEWVLAHDLDEIVGIAGLPWSCPVAEYVREQVGEGVIVAVSGGGFISIGDKDFPIAEDVGRVVGLVDASHVLEGAVSGEEFLEAILLAQEDIR